MVERAWLVDGSSHFRALSETGLHVGGKQKTHAIAFFVVVPSFVLSLLIPPRLLGPEVIPLPIGARRSCYFGVPGKRGPERPRTSNSAVDVRNGRVSLASHDGAAVPDAGPRWPK